MDANALHVRLPTYPANAYALAQPTRSPSAITSAIQLRVLALPLP